MLCVLSTEEVVSWCEDKRPRASTHAHIYAGPQQVVSTSILEVDPAGCFEASQDDLSTTLYPRFGERPFHAIGCIEILAPALGTKSVT